jgi:cbb3-type cytochrome oxidase subunit 3
MISQWLSEGDHVTWPLVALCVFIVVFVGMLVWIYRPGSKQFYEREAQLPLEDSASSSKGGDRSKQEETHGSGA